jgi:hypothetical protein
MFARVLTAMILAGLFLSDVRAEQPAADLPRTPEELRAFLGGHWRPVAREEDVKSEIEYFAWLNKNFETFKDTDGVSRYRKKDWGASGKPAPPTKEELQAEMKKRYRERLELAQLFELMEHRYFSAGGKFLLVERDESGDVDFNVAPFRIASASSPTAETEPGKFYLVLPEKDPSPRTEIRVLDKDRLQLVDQGRNELPVPRWIVTYQRVAKLPNWARKVPAQVVRELESE